jgi:alkanesulfonate monooxygenase SsuD/methylene tetrahydromethanopterin reductase-like flavin-dependent oxidoreductase (luciferase family)
VATTSPESHELAGSRGLGLLSFTVGVPPEELAGRLALYRKGLAVAKPIGKFVNERAATFTMVHCAETTAEAMASARDSFQWYAQTGVRQFQTLGTWQEELKRDYASYAYTRPIAKMDLSFLSFDYLTTTGSCIVGDPDRCIEVAQRYRAAGCDLLLCMMQPFGSPDVKVLRSIELVGRYVMPELK